MAREEAGVEHDIEAVIAATTRSQSGQFAEDVLVIAAVALDAEDPEVDRAFAEVYELSFKMLLEDGKVKKAYSHVYGIIGITHVARIDRDRRIVNREGIISMEG